MYQREGGRPLDIVGVQKIREHWGIIVPVNTSISINCRRKLLDNIEEPKKITADKDDFEKYTSNQDKPYDLRETLLTYDSNTASTIEDYNREHYVDLLNNYLNSRKVSAISLPIQSWKDSSKRTKKRYQGLFKECFYTIIDTFFPGEYDDIFDNICEDDEHQDEDDNGSSKMITALVESYEKSSAWQVRRQSIIGLTEYRYYVAQKHSILYGCAIPPSKTRNKMDPEKLSNFLDFITSSHIIKDLPFGERHLKLSSGEVMDAPNIIRCMGPEAIIQQYQAYCEENEISLLGSSTMFKILSECSATVRKSLEGLDYFVCLKDFIGISGNKADPTEVANEMRHKKLGNGERMFEINEFLSSQQINSYFSRTFRNLKSSSDQDQLAAAQFEQNLTNLNTSVMSKLSATN
ncbi:unnamed protein product [Mytilus coruscus]|uniref:Uncharacterized protein n=1 Tax=Mytilus coruscus TaxID=42192 RepID=A0A6J8D5R9_MYTCO|nr:unnamed protein product [Mytilus coruscus]